MIHMFTYHRPSGWKWRFAITEASDESGPAGTVVLQRHLGDAGIFRWDTIADVCSDPNEIPGVSYRTGKPFSNELGVSFTVESMARLAQTVEAYLRHSTKLASTSLPNRAWADFPPRMLRTVAIGQLIDEAAEKLKPSAPVVELDAEERQILRSLRHDASAPEHGDWCDACERRRKTIALLDRLLA